MLSGYQYLLLLCFCVCLYIWNKIQIYNHIHSRYIHTHLYESMYLHTERKENYINHWVRSCVIIWYIHLVTHHFTIFHISGIVHSAIHQRDECIFVNNWMVIKVTEVKLSCQEFYRLTFLKSLPQKKIVIIDKYILAQCWSHKNFREIAMVQNWKKNNWKPKR